MDELCYISYDPRFKAASPIRKSLRLRASAFNKVHQHGRGRPNALIIARFHKEEDYDLTHFST
jgi:hypothetical protein